jgi:hypothetical protein
MVNGQAQQVTFEVLPYASAQPRVTREAGSRYRQFPYATKETPTVTATTAMQDLNITGQVSQADGVWYRVKLSNGQTAYIRGDLTAPK